MQGSLQCGIARIIIQPAMHLEVSQRSVQGPTKHCPPTGGRRNMLAGILTLQLYPEVLPRSTALFTVKCICRYSLALLTVFDEWDERGVHSS